MIDDPTAEVLSFARRAVLWRVNCPESEREWCVVDEDTLMRVVPLLERHDLAWLEEVLANNDLSLDGRKEIYAYTALSPPWNEGEER